MRSIVKILKFVSGILVSALSIQLNLALADFDVRIKNNTKFYVQADLDVKAWGQNKFDYCNFFEIRSGLSKTITCASEVDNWRRAFVTSTDNSSNTPEWDCSVINIKHSCKILHNIKKVTWASGNNVKSPSNGRWHDKWVVRDHGLYDITIPSNYCGSVWRPNNDLTATGRNPVVTAEQRAAVRETLACMGINHSGFPDPIPTPQRRDIRRIKPKLLKRSE